MKTIINVLKFICCIVLSMTLMFLFSLLGGFAIALGYQHISPGLLTLLELFLGVPVLILILMPVLESAKRINYLNPYGNTGRIILALSTVLICLYLLYSSIAAENTLPAIVKISYLIYTAVIYLAFAIYTYNWDKEKVNPEWFVFSDR